MTNKVQGFIASERELSQLKHWLKSTYRISIEEFVVLYKVFEGEKISGKELRDTLHFEMLGIQVKLMSLSVKSIKKNLFQNCVLKQTNDKCIISSMRHKRN